VRRKKKINNYPTGISKAGSGVDEDLSERERTFGRAGSSSNRHPLRRASRQRKLFHRP